MSKQRVECWDCERILEVELPKEVVEKAPRLLDGTLVIICNECDAKDAGDY